MKLIKFLDDWYRDTYWFRNKNKNGTVVVSEELSKEFTKVHTYWDFDSGEEIKIQHAKIIKDLGLHFGNSKHVYLIDGRSRVYESRKP